MHILAAAAGVAALVAANPVLFTGLRIVGALYLLYLLAFTARWQVW